MTTSVLQIHSYNSIYRCEVQGEAEETVGYRALLHNTTHPEGSTPINEVNASSALRTKKWPMTGVVDWRLNIMAPRQTTGTWQNRPVQREKISMRYEFQFLYSSASRNDIH